MFLSLNLAPSKVRESFPRFHKYLRNVNRSVAALRYPDRRTSEMFREHISLMRCGTKPHLHRSFLIILPARTNEQVFACVPEVFNSRTTQPSLQRSPAFIRVAYAIFVRHFRCIPAREFR